jgi:hypothetical protein
MTASLGGYNETPGTFFNQGLHEISSTKKHKLGTVRWTDDGRKFVYALNGAADTTPGMLMSVAQTPIDATIAAADALINLAGSKTMSLTVAGLTAGSHADGYAIIKAGADIGNMYKIAGNTVTGTPATGRAYLTLYKPIETLHVAANTTVAVHKSPYASLIVNPAVADENATTAETVMGMSTRIVTAAYYFWAQTWGPASLVLDIDSAAGNESNEKLIVAGTTAGRGGIVIPTETSFFWNTQIIGYPLEKVDLTDAEGNLVFLTIG